VGERLLDARLDGTLYFEHDAAELRQTRSSADVGAARGRGETPVLPTDPWPGVTSCAGTEGDFVTNTKRKLKGYGTDPRRLRRHRHDRARGDLATIPIRDGGAARRRALPVRPENGDLHDLTPPRTIATAARYCGDHTQTNGIERHRQSVPDRVRVHSVLNMNGPRLGTGGLGQNNVKPTNGITCGNGVSTATASSPATSTPRRSTTPTNTSEPGRRERRPRGSENGDKCAWTKHAEHLTRAHQFAVQKPWEQRGVDAGKEAAPSRADARPVGRPIVPAPR